MDGHLHPYRYRYRVTLDERMSTISESWGPSSPAEGSTKWLQVEDVDNEMTSIRIMCQDGQGGVRSEGILVPTDLFRQMARWSVRTQR